MFKLLHRAGFRNARAVEMWRAYASLADPENRRAFTRTLRGVVDPGGQSVTAMDRLYLAARMPTLIIWGDRDNIIPISHALAAHEAIPGSRLEVIEGAGHFPHAEEPARFVEIVSEFILTTEPSRITLEERRKIDDSSRWRPDSHIRLSAVRCPQSAFSEICQPRDGQRCPMTVTHESGGRRG